jgi:hypothetical protein
VSLGGGKSLYTVLRDAGFDTEPNINYSAIDEQAGPDDDLYDRLVEEARVNYAGALTLYRYGSRGTELDAAIAAATAAGFSVVSDQSETFPGCMGVEEVQRKVVLK